MKCVQKASCIEGCCKGTGHPVTWHCRHRGEGGGMGLPILNLRARREWMVNVMPRPLYPRERAPVLITGGWVGTRAGLDGSGEEKIPWPHRGSNPGGKIL